MIRKKSLNVTGYVQQHGAQVWFLIGIYWFHQTQKRNNHDSVMKEPHLLWLMSSSFEDANKWSAWDEDQQRCHAYLHVSTLEKHTICKKIEKRSQLAMPKYACKSKNPIRW